MDADATGGILMSRTKELPADVVASAAELSGQMLAPLSRTSPRLGYVADLARDIPRAKRVPALQVMALVYEAVVNQGRSAGEATAWMRGAIAYAELWQDQRDGLRIGAVDPSPLEAREQRSENDGNLSEHRVACARGTDDEARVIREALVRSRREIDDQELRDAAWRDRLVLLEGRKPSGRTGGPFRCQSVRRFAAGKVQS